MLQCKICLRYFESVNDLSAHSQCLFRCERYDMDAIRRHVRETPPSVAMREP